MASWALISVHPSTVDAARKDQGVTDVTPDDRPTIDKPPRGRAGPRGGLSMVGRSSSVVSDETPDFLALWTVALPTPSSFAISLVERLSSGFCSK